MRFFNTYEGNIHQEQAIFKPNELDNLKEEIHSLKLKTRTLKIQARKGKYD